MANPFSTAEALIRARIAAAGGALPWAEFMQLALYEPGAGYYRHGVRRIGRGGDFYTSVSVGPLFGDLLGVFMARVWRALGSPADFALIEQGAHDGTLAADVLRGLQRHEPDLFAAAHLIILEPDEDLRAAQRITLGGFMAKLRHAASWSELAEAPATAVFYCNELPDAMPVHRVRFTCGGWRELFVAEGADGALAFVERDLSSRQLADELARCAASLPAGYEADINLAMLAWIRDVSLARFRGAALILDYGMTADEALSPERPKGTLRRYRRHRCDDRVLEEPGQCDLTAHVNFTRLAQEALAGGMSLVEFIEQGRFLTALASERWAKSSSPPDAAAQRQFHALAHPGIMGCSFHALVLSKGIEPGLLAPAQSEAAARRRLGWGD